MESGYDDRFIAGGYRFHAGTAGAENYRKLVMKHQNTKKSAPEPKRRALRYLIITIVFILMGVGTMGALVIYDSGAHAAWAEESESLRSVGEIREYVARWPVTTLGGKALKKAVELFTDETLKTESILSEAEELRPTGAFEKVSMLLSSAGEGATPAQQQRLHQLKVWVEERRSAWELLTGQLAALTDEARYSDSFCVFKKTARLFPLKKRDITCPVCIRSFPSGAFIEDEERYIGETPKWVHAYACSSYHVKKPGFFAEPLRPVELWEHESRKLQLKPVPDWMVEGGGPFALHNEYIYLFSTDRVVRRLHRRSGRMLCQALSGNESAASGNIAFLDTCLVAGGRGVIRVYDTASLRELRSVSVGGRDEMLYVSNVNANSIIAGGAECGNMVLSGEKCRLTKRFPGKGPAGCYLPWEGGAAFRTIGGDIVSIDRDALSLLILGRMTGERLFGCGGYLCGLQQNKKIRIWDGGGSVAGSIRIPAGLTVSSFDTGGGLIAVGTENGVVQLFSLSEKTMLWCKQLKGSRIMSLELAEENLAVETEKDGIFVVETGSGKPRFCIPAEGRVQMLFKDGRLLVSDDRALYCYRAAP